MKKSKLLILPGILFILLISCSDSNDKLYNAIAKGSLSEVEELIESGVDINYKYKNDRNKSEYTALHYAVKYREYDIAELLIEKGANVNAVDIYDWHPLMYAVNDGNLELAELLLQNGADLKQENTDTGSSAIDYATINNDTEMINLLLKYEKGKENITLPVKIKNTISFKKNHNNIVEFKFFMSNISDTLSTQVLYDNIFLNAKLIINKAIINLVELDNLHKKEILIIKNVNIVEFYDLNKNEVLSENDGVDFSWDASVNSLKTKYGNVFTVQWKYLNAYSNIIEVNIEKRTIVDIINIDKEKALEIANNDAQKAYRDLSIYNIKAELTDEEWHIDYNLSDPQMLGGGPHYVISAKTGKILSFRYEQ